jgi:hypothetical protein
MTLRPAMTGRTTGNLMLMTGICVVIFWIFMALRPAQAGQYYDWECPGGVVIHTQHTIGFRSTNQRRPIPMI